MINFVRVAVNKKKIECDKSYVKNSGRCLLACFKTDGNFDARADFVLSCVTKKAYHDKVLVVPRMEHIPQIVKFLFFAPCGGLFFYLINV